MSFANAIPIFGETLLNGVIATGAGAATNRSGNGSVAYQAVVTGSGAVSATVVVEVSNDGTNFVTLGTISPSGTTSASDGFGSVIPWKQHRGNVTAISGTNAAVTLTAAA